MDNPEGAALVRRFFADVVNTGAGERAAEFIARDYIDHYAGPDAARGPTIVAEHVAAVRRTYPDLHVAVDQQFTDGEFVISRVTASGTHSGDWLGMAPTGRRVRITAVNIDRVVAGKIVEHWGMANTLEALLEAGILTPPLAP